MESILNLIAKFYEDVLDILRKWTNGAIDFTIDVLMDTLSESAVGLVRELTETAVALMSEAFFASEERIESGFVAKYRGREKGLLTRYGMIHLRNDVYEDRNAGPNARVNVRPVIEALGLRPHQQISDSITEALVKTTMNHSLRESALLVTGGEVSHQTVRNALGRLGPTEMFELPSPRRKVEALDVFLDEDHIALQNDPKGRKHTVIPLGVVCEGRYQEGKNHDGRVRLLNPRYFVSPNLSSAEVVASIEGYIEATYDPDTLKVIRVHGDGAGWIRKALADHPLVQHVLDGFHLERALRRFAKRCNGQKGSVHRKLCNALKKDDKTRFCAIVAEAAAGVTDQNKVEANKKSIDYILNNWDASVKRMQDGMTGSCTEAQVQHVLSCRMSTLPKSWSRQHAGIVASLRAATMNGVDICHPKPHERQTGGYIRYFEQTIEDARKGPFNWSIFEQEPVVLDGNSGTQHLLHLIELGGHRSKVC